MDTEKEVERAAARLRKSRAEYEKEEKAYGQAAGRRFVLEDAEYPEVQALAEFELSGYPEHAWSELVEKLKERGQIVAAMWIHIGGPGSDAGYSGCRRHLGAPEGRA